MTSSVLDAAYLTAHNYPGGIAPLAIRIGAKNAAVLSHKLNPNDSANHLTVSDLMAIMMMTGDHSALHAAAQSLGYMVLPLPTIDDETATEAITDTVKEFADFLQVVTKSLTDKKITKTELRQVRKELGELVAQGGKLESILAAMESKQGRHS
ncbi:MAG: phage regulatory CII family protein [Sideroxydans sp.]|jgi:hypothetical protein